MALVGLDGFMPSLEGAHEPVVIPVPAGAVKVLPRWSDEDEVMKWRLKYRMLHVEGADVMILDGSIDDGEEWIELELHAFTRELPLTGLAHGHLHNFKVAIQTKNGWSDWSRVVPCVPPSPELPGKCAAVFAMVKGKTTALVRWTRPIDFAAAISCGHITRYKLRITWPPLEGEDAHSCAFEVVIEGDADEYEVPELECLRDYRFQVAAENVAGWGEWSDPSPILNMPPPVPQPPPQPTMRRATHHSAVIQWQHPPSGDAPIDSFRFRYTSNEDFSKGGEEVHDVPANLSQYVIEGLQAGKTYIFQARALNKYGMGIWSESSIPIKTLNGHEPSKIQEFSIPHVYRSFIMLQWRPASENGFEISQHYLRYAHSPDMEGAVKLEPTVVRKGGFDTCELRHLQKKTYYFQVACKNKKGPSEWSDPVVVSLPEDAQKMALTDTQKLAITA
jgi:hypothetical protein